MVPGLLDDEHGDVGLVEDAALNGAVDQALEPPVVVRPHHDHVRLMLAAGADDGIRRISDVAERRCVGKLGGIGDLVSDRVKDLSKKFNKGKTIEVVNQKLGYLARCGDPDIVDSIVPMAYGNIAMELLLKGVHGRLVVLANGSYGNIPIETITSMKKVVDIKEHYNTERLRPQFSSFEKRPLFII